MGSDKMVSKERQLSVERDWPGSFLEYVVVSGHLKDRRTSTGTSSFISHPHRHHMYLAGP